MSTSEDAIEPILELADYTQYLLRAKSEVLFILRGLAAAVDRVTIYFNEGKDFLLTSVIAVDDNSLTLDYGSDEEMNRRALSAEKLFCVTNHEKVRVQFLLRGLRRIEAGDGPAFRADLPESVLRLQRREFYRLTTPLAHPIKCRIPITNGGSGQQIIEATVVDISGGGLAVMVPPAGVVFEPNMEFPNCRIELPEVGIIVATLKVRSLFDVTLRSGGQVARAGCQFINLPGPMLTLVQRYILKVERERKAREAGLS